MKNIAKVIALIILTSCISEVCAETIESASDGKWSDSRVWVGGRVPGRGDDVVIKHYISVEDEVESGSIVMSYSKKSGTTKQGTLTIEAGVKLTTGEMKQTNDKHKSTVSGTLVAQSIIISGGTMEIKGSVVATMVHVSGGRLSNAGTMTMENAYVTGGNWDSVDDVGFMRCERLTVKDGMYNNNRGVTEVTKQAVIEDTGEIGGGGVLRLKGEMEGEGNECVRIKGRLAGTVDIYGNVYNEGSMEPRVDERTCRFVGKRPQTVTTTKDLTYYYLEIDNRSGKGEGVHFEGGNVVVKKRLTLTNGVVYMDDERYMKLDVVAKYDSSLGVERRDLESRSVLVAENKESYVDGLFMRVVNMNRRYLFPVGNKGKEGFVVLDSNDQDMWGVRYRNEKPPMTGSESDDLREVIKYEMMSSEYWELSMETCNYVGSSYSRGINVRLTGEEGAESTLYKYDNGAENATWEEMERAQKIRHLLYDGEMMGFVGVVAQYDNYAGFNRDVKLLPGKHDEGKTICFATGVKSEVIDKMIAEKSEEGQCVWTGRAGDNDWNNSKNWLWWRVPTADDEVVIKDRCEIDGRMVVAEEYPIIRAEDEMGRAKKMVIGGRGAMVTLDGGALVVDGEIEVEDSERGHVVINNRVEMNSALKYGSMDYDGVVVKREFRAGILYYTGSATEEGRYSGEDGAEVGRLTVYDPMTGKYEERSIMDGNWKGGTLGILGSYDEKKSIVQTGQLYRGDGTIELAKGEETWNLVVNPYMYGIDMSDGGLADFGEAYETVWFRKYRDGAYCYTTYNNAARVGVSEGEREQETESVLAPQQAFFVLSTSAENPYIKIDSDARVCYGISSKLKLDRKESGVIRISLESGNGIGDEVAIVMREGGSMDVGTNDSPKHENNGSGHNQIYVCKNGERMSIPYYPSVAEMSGKNIELGMKLADGEREGVIKIGGDMDVDGKVYLRDRETGETTELVAGGRYNFGTVDGGEITGRFELTVVSESIGTGKLDIKDIGKVETKIYDMAGRLVAVVNDGDETSVATLKKGIYVVAKRSKSGLETRKMVK